MESAKAWKRHVFWVEICLVDRERERETWFGVFG